MINLGHDYDSRFSDSMQGKNIDRLLFTDGLRDEVQLRGEAVLSAGWSI